MNLGLSYKKYWLFPFIFGILGAFIGLFLRLGFTGIIPDFPIKFVTHSHSHVMMLGFVFNALILLVIKCFSINFDTLLQKLFTGLQVCIAIFMISFLVQGYGVISIIFSTLHLWISYWLLIRLWKKLPKSEVNVLIKAGIIFHFIASIGPYTLGPLMALKLKASPWYQQAIFFYLHFQYFGVFFLWLLAVLFKKNTIKITKNKQFAIAGALALLYAHSLRYHFDNIVLQVASVTGSGVLCVLFFSLYKQFLRVHRLYKIIYLFLLLLSAFNFIGSFSFAENLIQDRFVLIAWLHFIFLGVYVPFIWVSYDDKTSSKLLIFYAISFFVSECLLLFPQKCYQLTKIPIPWQLFSGYLLVFVGILIIHLKRLKKIIFLQ